MKQFFRILGAKTFRCDRQRLPRQVFSGGTVFVMRHVAEFTLHLREASGWPRKLGVRSLCKGCRRDEQQEESGDNESHEYFREV